MKIKKLLIILLVCASVLSFASCKQSDGGDNAGSLVGTWIYYNHSELRDYVTNIIDADAMQKVYYQFNEDGTGKSWLEFNTEKLLTFNYTYNGSVLTLTFNDGTTENQPCIMNGNTITVGEGDKAIEFIKQE